MTAGEKSARRAVIAHSDTVVALERLSGEFRLCTRVLTAALSQPQQFPAVVSWRSLGTVGLFLALAPQDALDSVTAKTMSPVYEYDDAHHTTLAKTALVFLDEDRSVAATARRLVLHPNTVRQRVERIDKLLGADWRQGRRALNIHNLLIIDAAKDAARFS